MQSDFCLPVNQLLELHKGKLIYVLLKFIPIMLVTKENVSVLLDFEELSLKKMLLTCFLLEEMLRLKR